MSGCHRHARVFVSPSFEIQNRNPISKIAVRRPLFAKSQGWAIGITFAETNATNNLKAGNQRQHGGTNMSAFKKLIALGAILPILYLSCSPTGPAPTQGNVKISVRAIGNTSAAKSSSPLINSVTISSAQVVIREVEFESSFEDSIDFELEQPFVRDLAVDSTLQQITTIQLPFGTYEEMEIEIGRLDSTDGAVFTQNPLLQNLSIRVQGFVDADPSNTFVFSSDISVEQENEFDSPLVVDETTPSTNVVLMLDMSRWFVDDNNNPIDPTLAGNQRAIESNIKASIKMFEDDDDDGHDDDDDDDDGNGDDDED
jgi:hypothetical protein